MPSPLNGSNYSVASANAHTELIASATRCTEFRIENDSTAILYILLTPGTASATNYSVKVAANGGAYNSPRGLMEIGAINGFWAAQNGAARVTVLTW